jgi:hypothetical protein
MSENFANKMSVFDICKSKLFIISFFKRLVCVIDYTYLLYITYNKNKLMKFYIINLLYLLILFYRSHSRKIN